MLWTQELAEVLHPSMLTLAQHCLPTQMELWPHAFQQDEVGLGGMLQEIMSAALPEL